MGKQLTLNEKNNMFPSFLWNIKISYSTQVEVPRGSLFFRLISWRVFCFFRNKESVGRSFRNHAICIALYGGLGLLPNRLSKQFFSECEWDEAKKRKNSFSYFEGFSQSRSHILGKLVGVDISVIVQISPVLYGTEARLRTVWYGA